MFGVLDRYIGRTILNTILMTLLMLVSLSGIIKFVDQLRKVGQGGLLGGLCGYVHYPEHPKGHRGFLPDGGPLRGITGAWDFSQSQ